jgi:ATP-dependent DNA ligase
VRPARQHDLLQPDPECIGHSDALVFFLFDLLHLDGAAVSPRPLRERKERLRELLSQAKFASAIQHQIGRGRAFYEHVCGLKLEGIISKQADAPYAPGNRGLWFGRVTPVTWRIRSGGSARHARLG